MPSHMTGAFKHEAWRKAPLMFWQQAHLAQELWWSEATREVRGMNPKRAKRVRFMVDQVLDAASPSNIPWINPEVVEATMREGGANLVRGAKEPDRGCACTAGIGGIADP